MYKWLQDKVGTIAVIGADRWNDRSVGVVKVCKFKRT